MEKTQNWKIIALCGLTLVLLVVSGCGGGTGFATAPPNCPKYDCKLTTKQATQFESKIKDDKGGCFAGLADCSASVSIKNKESQPVLVYVTATCRTIDKQITAESKKYWMQPGEEYDFDIPTGAGIGNDWRCENFLIHSSQIAGCEVYEVK